MPPSLQTPLAVRALDDRRSCFVPGSVRTVILCRPELSNAEGAWEKVKGTRDKMLDSHSKLNSLIFRL